MAVAEALMPAEPDLPEPGAPRPRAWMYRPFIELLTGLQDTLGLPDNQFAADEVGCTPAEWSRFKALQRRPSERVVAGLLARHATWSKTYWACFNAERREKGLAPVPLPGSQRPRKATRDSVPDG